MIPISAEKIALLIRDLEAELPRDAMSLDPDDLKTFGRDWTKAIAPNPSLIVFPKSTTDVIHIVQTCSKHGIPLVPSGGRTGLAGGAVAAKQEVVLSFDRMRSIGEINPLSMTVKVQAGAITEAVHEATRPFGLTWPVDFASKGSSAVGGNIATNAGGVRVIRYGLTRNWVLGLTVVLPNGDVLELNGALEKNNTGLDLRQLFIGTEGTLGIITEATLKLAPLPGPSEVFLFGMKDLPAVFRFFQECRVGAVPLNAFECFSDDCLQVVLSHRGFSSPFAASHSQYVLIELDAGGARLDAWFESIFDRGLVEDGVQAKSPTDAAHLWSLREGIAESLAAKGLNHKHDIALPIDRLQDFLAGWTADFGATYPGLKPYIFGHIGDGNLHVNFVKSADMEVDSFRQLCAQADEGMFSWIQKFQGSVSAEHGIGLLKKHMLKYTRTESEIALMRSFKRVLDPKNILNPGKIFD